MAHYVLGVGTSQVFKCQLYFDISLVTPMLRMVDSRLSECTERGEVTAVLKGDVLFVSLGENQEVMVS